MREQLAHLTSELIAGLIRDVAADQLSLALVVAGGAANFRIRFRRIFHGLPVSDDLANSTYAWLSAQWVTRYPRTDPEVWLDGIHVPSPVPEIDPLRVSDWELESASSAEARAHYYNGQNPREILDRLIREDNDKAKSQ